MDNVVTEIFFLAECVVNQCAKKNDVAARPQWYPVVGHGGSTIKTRINVDDLRALLSSLHHPLKADGMVFRHGRSHDQNGIRELEVLLRGGCAASSKR